MLLKLNKKLGQKKVRKKKLKMNLQRKLLENKSNLFKKTNQPAIINRMEQKILQD